MVPVQAVGGGGPVKESPVERGQIIGTEVMLGECYRFVLGTITYIDEQKKNYLPMDTQPSVKGMSTYLCPVDMFTLYIQVVHDL